MEKEIKLTELDQSNLLESARWGKFLAIVGFIMSGFIVILGLGLMVFAGGTFGEVYPGFAGGGIGFIYMLMSLLYIFPSLYLFRFSTQIKAGIAAGDQEKCSAAYNNLRRLFMFMGVLTLIVLSLYALAILMFIVVGGAMGGFLNA